LPNETDALFRETQSESGVTLPTSCQHEVSDGLLIGNRMDRKMEQRIKK